MRVLDLTPKRQLRTEVSAGTAYELLVSLSLAQEKSDAWDGYDLGAEWFEGVQRSISPELRQLIADAGFHEYMWIQLIGLAYDTPEPRDAMAFIERLAQVPAVEIRMLLLGGCYRETAGQFGPDVIRAAAEGDVRAGEALAEGWSGHHQDIKESLPKLVAQPPEQTKEALARILRLWHRDVFQSMERTIQPVIERDAAAKRELAKTLTPERLTEVATKGLQYSGEPGISRIVFIPSYLFRPWSMISEYRDAKILIYAVADESLEAEDEAPPPHLIRLVEALADEKRLRILRRVAEGPATMHELAEYMDMAKSSIHHHIAILRAAGLLSSPAGVKRYSLRADALKEIPGLLDSYLTDTETSPRAPAAASERSGR